MLVNRELRPCLAHLDDIYRHCNKRYGYSKPLVIYNTTLEFVRYWRQLEAKGFYGFSDDAKDELYYCINWRLMEICDLHLDLYWMAWEYDNKPLYECGREPDKFWSRKQFVRPWLRK